MSKEKYIFVYEEIGFDNNESVSIYKLKSNVELETFPDVFDDEFLNETFEYICTFTNCDLPTDISDDIDYAIYTKYEDDTVYHREE